MAVVGFVPGFLVSAATVHHDSWVAALGALGIWRAFAYLRNPRLRMLALAAVLFGLAALTKASMLALMLLLPLAVGLVWWRDGAGRQRLRDVSVAVVVFAVVVGWWLVRNQVLYGDPLGWGVFLASPLWPVDQRPINLMTILAELVDEWAPGSSFWRTLVFGAGQMTFGQWPWLAAAFVAVLGGKVALAILGYGRRGTARLWGANALFAIGAVGLVAATIVRYSLSFPGPNGRYLFPALPVIALGAVLGWRALLSKLALKPIAGLVILGLAALAVLTPPGLFLPQYVLAQRLSPQEAGQVTANRAVTFGRLIELVRADVNPERAEPSTPIHVRLTWRALDDIPRSYRAFVHMIGVDGATVGGIDRVPGSGAASTGLWHRGDMVFDEFELRLREGVGPGLYRVVSGFYRFPDLQRLSAEGVEVGAGDVALVGQVKVLPSVVWAGAPLAQFGGDMTLAQAEVAPRLPRVGENIEIRLLWKVAVKPKENYTMSVQLLGPEGNLLAQRDSPPLNGALPTSAWDVGDLIPDVMTVQVPTGAPARFSAQLVVYSAATGQRLQVAGRDSLSLASLTLEP